MPVLVTGATGMVGRRLAHALAGTGGEVRAYGRTDDGALRALGCRIAVGAADDEGRLEAALTGVHTIVHLIGGFPARGVSTRWLVEETVTVALRAASNAGVRRFIYLSCAGADPRSPIAHRAAKGRAEAAVRDFEGEYAIFRATPIVGPDGALAAYLERFRGARVVPVPGTGRQRLNPVSLADVVAALVAADAREAEVRGVWDLGGPDVTTFEDLVARALGPARTVGARRVPIGARGLTDAWAEETVVDPKPAAAQFDLPLVPLREALDGLARS